MAVPVSTGYTALQLMYGAAPSMTKAGVGECKEASLRLADTILIADPNPQKRVWMG